MKSFQFVLAFVVFFLACTVNSFAQCENGKCRQPLIDGQAIGVIGAKAFAVRESTIRAASGIAGHAMKSRPGEFVGVAVGTSRRALQTCTPQRGRKVAQSIVKRNGMFYKTTVWR